MTYNSYRFWLTLASLTDFNSSLSMAMMILVKGEFLIWLMTQRSNVIMGENGWKSEGENKSKVEVPMMGKMNGGEVRSWSVMCLVLCVTLNPVREKTVLRHLYTSRSDVQRISFSGKTENSGHVSRVFVWGSVPNRVGFVSPWISRWGHMTVPH